MTMTDPIADMLTRLRNANAAYQDSVSMPYSKIKVHLAEILQQEGYIGGFEVRDAEVQGPRLHAVHALRAAARRLPEVRPVPHLLPHDGAPGRTARHHEVQLVTINTPQVRTGTTNRKPRRGRPKRPCQ